MKLRKKIDLKVFYWWDHWYPYAKYYDHIYTIGKIDKFKKEKT